MQLKKTIGTNILHVPHYNIPALVKFNLVVTIHDLIHIVYPQGASKKFASTYMKFMVDRVLKLSKKIICVSESTKEALENIHGEKCLKISVIHEGIDENFFCIENKEYLSQIKTRYKLPDKFILYVGSIRRHKNIKTLLEVFEKLKVKLPDVYLVIVGRFSQALNLNQDGVLYLGEVPQDKELAAIYNLASCFCNLSFHEGFSLTLLEAQNCGIPVVCSNIPTHIETGADAILSVNPTETDSIEAALYNILTQKELRENLINKGFNNAKRFNWASSAQATLDLYKNLS
jgi:glycosyltransferase involved in cell wall biosynthesis